MKTVTILDSEAMNQAWGHGPFMIITRTIEIEDQCPVCGGPRGEPTLTTKYEDGESASIHTWINTCGHVDKYSDLLRSHG